MSTLKFINLCRLSINKRLLTGVTRVPILYNQNSCRYEATILEPDIDILGDFDADVKKHLKYRRRRTIVTKFEDDSHKIGIPIIKCKNPKLNFYRNKTYDKFEHIPLASEGWRNHKSVGDEFTVKVHTDDYEVQKPIPKPFSESGLNSKVLEILKSKGIENMSQIQKMAIPEILSGHNNLVGAETGTGKTLAFLLPAVEQVLRLKPKIDPKFNAPYILVITPTRELSDQIRDIVKWFEPLGITCKGLLGGNIKHQILNPSFTEINILVSTLGAIQKLTNSKLYSLENVRHVVLDEADTLLDDSFNHLLCRFLGKLKIRSEPSEDIDEGVQLTLVGATMPTSLDEILKNIVDTERIQTVVTEKLNQILPHVTQKFIRTGRTAKPATFLHIIKKLHKKKAPTIIFCKKTETTFWLSSFLEGCGIPHLNLNGEISLQERKGIFERFQKGEINILVCSSFASRGLDTNRAEYVINYEIPTFIVDYIHQCGRIGRINSKKPGIVINLVSGRNEVEMVQKIELSIRTHSKFENVNPNIKRILHFRNANSSIGDVNVSDDNPDEESVEINESVELK